MDCQHCGAKMRPLFTGFFCPKDCDRDRSNVPSRWRPLANGWLFQQRRIGEGIPDDAVRFDGWDAGIVPDDQMIEAAICFHRNRPTAPGMLIFANRRTEERFKNRYLLVFKEEK